MDWFDPTITQETHKGKQSNRPGALFFCLSRHRSSPSLRSSLPHDSLTSINSPSWPRIYVFLLSHFCPQSLSPFSFLLASFYIVHFTRTFQPQPPNAHTPPAHSSPFVRSQPRHFLFACRVSYAIISFNSRSHTDWTTSYHSRHLSDLT